MPANSNDDSFFMKFQYAFAFNPFALLLWRGYTAAFDWSFIICHSYTCYAAAVGYATRGITIFRRHVSRGGLGRPPRKVSEAKNFF